MRFVYSRIKIITATEKFGITEKARGFAAGLLRSYVYRIEVYDGVVIRVYRFYYQVDIIENFQLALFYVAGDCGVE